ncbi:MAG: lysophospholipid acyltransferase family protein [Paludibacteraceae bacterium]
MMYYIALGFVRLISLFPFPVLYFFSDLIYLIIYYTIGYRKQVVRDNLRYSFPEKTESERRKIEKKFYLHFCDLFMESFKLIGISESEINKRMRYINYEPLIEHYDENRCVMLQTSHFGNWEWTSSFSLFLPEDKPVYQIYKKQTGAVSDHIIYKIRQHFGAENIEMKNVLRQMISMYKEGSLGMYGMISDQSPARGSLHYYTEFLNQRTAVITGTEQLARKFNYPVYYARLRKLKRGYYTCEFIPIALNPQETTEFEISEKYMRLLEEDIKCDPSIWLWSHKRWKYTRKS